MSIGTIVMCGLGVVNGVITVGFFGEVIMLIVSDWLGKREMWKRVNMASDRSLLRPMGSRKEIE